MATAAQDNPAAPPPAPPPAPVAADLAEPYLSRHLSSLGLAVEYVRAEGNTLYHLDADGAEIPVLDLAGGFGSTILGHNHPGIVSCARDLLDRQAPVFAQFSLHSYAHTVAERLNAILRRESGDDEPYMAVFANSGAEAIEVAVKHAELDRVLKLSEMTRTIQDNVETVRSAVCRGAAGIPDDAWHRLRVRPPASGVAADAAEALVTAVRAHNTEVAQSPPLLLALEGSFHGKLVGSVQLTHNAAFRAPFRALGVQSRFVPTGRPDVLDGIIAAERRSLFGLAVHDRRVHLTEHPMPRFCAFVLEPVQGEGGIRVLDEEFTRRIRRACAEAGCPVVVDEIQSGMGRTGSFFASSAIGLRGDYYVLGKSLGGGLTKAAVTLVRGSLYRPQFEMAHSSTFAKDGFSTLVAARTLDLLEAGGGRAYRQAEERGERLTAALDTVRRDFPDVVRDVRGMGLMIGLELHDLSDSPCSAIREHARAGTLGYAAAGYLLQAHSVRIFPTASAPATLRFEPSIHLTDSEIGHAGAALRALCGVLREHDRERLLARPARPAGKGKEH